MAGIQPAPQAKPARLGREHPRQDRLGKPPPALPDQAPQEASPDERGAYRKVADTVGMVPPLRMKDQLRQGIIVGVGVLTGVPVGFSPEAAAAPPPAWCRVAWDPARS